MFLWAGGMRVGFAFEGDVAGAVDIVQADFWILYVRERERESVEGGGIGDQFSGFLVVGLVVLASI